jgi:hypothetical protein
MPLTMNKTSKSTSPAAWRWPACWASSCWAWPGKCGWRRSGPGGSLLALKVLPLCIPLAGILKNRMYTYRWVSLLVWLYFTEGVVRAWSDRAPGNYLAFIEVLLCLTLFAPARCMCVCA